MRIPGQKPAKDNNAAMRIPYFSGPDLRGVDLMTLIPEHNVAWEEDTETGRITVLAPRYTGFLTRRILQPRLPESKKYIRITLESRGSFLWRQIDGRASLGDITRVFMAEHPEDVQDAPQRVASYLYQMADNKFLTLLNPVSRIP